MDKITGEETRACVHARIMSGTHNGFIAYGDGQPVGWVNAGIKDNYRLIMENEEIGYDQEKKVGAIVCFVIDHKHRGKGIAKALLNAACKDFEDSGYDYIEAYPLKSPRNEAENYHGPLQMYLGYGFEITKELENVSVVTKYLK